jgi:hypothetical protein
VGADGRYYFKGVEPGSYIIQVQGTNYPANVNAEYVELPAILVNLDSK